MRLYDHRQPNSPLADGAAKRLIPLDTVNNNKQQEEAEPQLSIPGGSGLNERERTDAAPWSSRSCSGLGRFALDAEVNSIQRD